METLFNNPILMKLQAWGQKLGANKFLNAIQMGMMSVMAPIMVGAISQIICNAGTMLGILDASSALYANLYAPYKYTMNFIALWVVAFIAYHYAKNLKMKSPINNAIDAVIIFLLSCANIGEGGLDTTWLGATGMFSGFIIVLAVIRIEKFCADKNIRIPLPDVCPPSLVNAFAAIIPLLINVVIFQLVSAVLGLLSMNIPILIMAILMAPLSAMTSIPGMFIICGFALILWCFGIHGTMIVYPIIMTAMIEAAQTNAALHAAGEALVFFPVSLFAVLNVCGGTGNTMALCLLGLKSKSKQIRAISRVGIVPGWFGINEPVAFGMPIMYNPVMCIPYVLNTLVLMVLYVIAYKTGIIIPAWISISAAMPMGFGAYFATLNPMNLIWVYLMLIPSGLIWFPFLKVYEKQLCAQEAAQEAEEAAEA